MHSSRTYVCTDESVVLFYVLLDASPRVSPDQELASKGDAKFDVIGAAQCVGSVCVSLGELKLFLVAGARRGVAKGTGLCH